MSEKFPTRNFPVQPTAFASRSAILLLSTLALCSAFLTYNSISSQTFHAQPTNVEEILSYCRFLRAQAGPPMDFHNRSSSDRYEPGQDKAYLITNATIFTGKKLENGTIEVLSASDVLMSKGIIRAIGKDVPRELVEEQRELTVIKANGSWVTPGLVDINSHLGVFSSPAMQGADELNSEKGPVLPWLRSIEGFHTYDNGFELAIAAGVTSVQVSAGSANNIGGQAFVVKLRKTAEGSPSSMIVEPPHTLNSSDANAESSTRWRHLIQSCNEETRRYGNRLDGMWSLRSAYYEAKKVMVAQDAFCTKVEAGLWDSFPQEARVPNSFQWEMLVDVLRGKVKVMNDCYETVDLDNMARLSREFKFSLAVFLHASEAWLAPGILNNTWGTPPAVALLSTNHRYSRESYRGSEFAPRILADNNVSVIMTSDFPVVNPRQLLNEARKAYHFGLSAELALASVTSAPADALGVAHRIGVLQKGSDADLVLWDANPLQLGTTPTFVWIDGVMQISLQEGSDRTGYFAGQEQGGGPRNSLPGSPVYDKERTQTLHSNGLPSLDGKLRGGQVVFRNVKQVWDRGQDGSIEEVFAVGDQVSLGIVVVDEGKIICVGMQEDCRVDVDLVHPEYIDLHGGSISPGLMSYGSPLGLEEIASEPTTRDGRLYNAYRTNVPAILHDTGGLVRAVDALMFGTRHAQLAYRLGVTLATSSLARPLRIRETDGVVIWGLSATFNTGAVHALEQGAIIQQEVALHIRLARPLSDNGVSVSTQIAGLRRLLYGWENGDTETGTWFRKAAEGVIPLVIDVDSVDIMASLLTLRAEVDDRIGGQMRLVFSGAAESHLLAKELHDARVGVILTSLQPFSATWDERRMSAGPPLTNDTTLNILLDHGVTVGVGVKYPQFACETRFDLSQAMLESKGRLNGLSALKLTTTNLEHMLGVKGLDKDSTELVAFDNGNVFDLSSKVVASISSQKKGVVIF